MIRKSSCFVFILWLLVQPYSLKPQQYVNSLTQSFDMKQSAIAIATFIFAYISYNFTIQKLAYRFADTNHIEHAAVFEDGSWQKGGIGMPTNGWCSYIFIASCIQYEPKNLYERFIKRQALAIAEDAFINQSAFKNVLKGRSNTLSAFIQGKSTKNLTNLFNSLTCGEEGVFAPTGGQTYHATDMILTRVISNALCSSKDDVENTANKTLNLWAAQTSYLNNHLKDAQEVLKICMQPLV